jgi:hypothetical protein
VNTSVVYTVPAVGSGAVRALFSDWQLAPLIRWQSGNRSSVTTGGVDTALTGMGGQRAVQVLDDPYGDGTETNYLNRAAFASPATGTYSSLAPFTIVNPSAWQDDFALTRTFRLGSGQGLQVRWEVFNMFNLVNLNAPVTALNSGSFGTIQTAGDPRIMQFALKFTF